MSNASGILDYCGLFKWAQKAVVWVNPAQPRTLNQCIRHSEKHITAITRLRIEYLFLSALPAKIVWLVTAYFFHFIILARNTLSFIEEIKVKRQNSALTDLYIRVIQELYILQGAHFGWKDRPLDSFYPKPMCPEMSTCIKSSGLNYLVLLN